VLLTRFALALPLLRAIALVSLEELRGGGLSSKDKSRRARASRCVRSSSSSLCRAGWL
jgi:hypothetical protein